MKIQSLNQHERLKREKIIKTLFAGKSPSVAAYPIRAVFLPNALIEPSAGVPCQAAFSVSKKNFKRAHDRNRIKRLLREAYRLQKPSFYAFLKEKDLNCALIFLFTSKDMPDFDTISIKMNKLLLKLVENLEKNKIPLQS